MTAPVAAGTISLEWDPVADATGYRVHHGLAPGAYGATVDVDVGTQVVLTRLPNCTTHYTAVTAYNAYGESALSNEISGWPRPRIQEYSPLATLDGRQLVLHISGFNFQPGATLELDTSAFPDQPGAVQVESVTVLDCEHIEAQLTVESIPPYLGGRELVFRVLNGDGGVSLPRALTVVASVPTSRVGLVAVDSEEPFAGPGHYAVDGNPDTFWITEWMQSSPPPPHEITVALQTPHTLEAFSYLPRQTPSADGSIREYELAVSLNGLEWQLVASGVLVDDAADRSERVVRFPAVSARFVRLRALSEVNGGPWSSAAELSFAGVRGIVAPSVAIDAPASDIVIQPGGGASFAGTGIAAGGPWQLTYAWSFPPCAPASSHRDPDPGWVQFDCAPGDYPVTLTVCSNVGLCSTARRRVSVMSAGCSPIDSGDLTVVYADSQELLVEDGAAVNAIDGDPESFWVTQWEGASVAGLPHVIVVGLAVQRQLCGFAYLPRQDGGVNGTIREFEFQVRFMPEGWSTVASGPLVEDAQDFSERVFAFPVTDNQMVRLLALRELNDGPWTSAGEITLYAQPEP